MWVLPLTADQNAESTVNVPVIWPVSVKSVVIHALVHVEFMPSVKWSITMPSADANKDMRVTHSEDVAELQHVSTARLFYFIVFYGHDI